MHPSVHASTHAPPAPPTTWRRPAAPTNPATHLQPRPTPPHPSRPPTCPPTCPPQVVYVQLVYAARSRINACPDGAKPDWPLDHYRWVGGGVGGGGGGWGRVPACAPLRRAHDAPCAATPAAVDAAAPCKPTPRQLHLAHGRRHQRQPDPGGLAQEPPVDRGDPQARARARGRRRHRGRVRKALHQRGRPRQGRGVEVVLLGRALLRHHPGPAGLGERDRLRGWAARGPSGALFPPRAAPGRRLGGAGHGRGRQGSWRPGHSPDTDRSHPNTPRPAVQGT